MIVASIFFIPLKVIDLGFVPQDDVLRHVAKVISGKDWGQILVMRSEIKMDSHPGWHVFLGAIQRVFDLNAHGLVIFSVLFSFVLFSTVPLLSLRRPEAWICSLLVVTLLDFSKMQRLLLGRPYLVTSAAVAAICFLWQGLLADRKSRYRTVMVLTIFIALATWLHGSWYIFGIPVLAFFLARQWRAGFFILLATILGIGSGLLLTGHPVVFLIQTTTHGILAFSNYVHSFLLVSEFQPFSGDSFIVILFVLMLIWRALRGEWNRAVIDNPVVMIIAVSWVSGFLMRRLWVDTGMTAFFVWVALEFQDIISKRVPFLSRGRFLLVGVLSLVLCLVATNDYARRWSSCKPRLFLTFDTPEKSAWAPGNGGIVYNTEMGTFYSTFYMNPTARWRYVLGFEPGIMLPDDLATFREIQLNYTPSSFNPWLKKMRPEDRLIIVDEKERIANKIKSLQWYDAGTGVWIGRLPMKEAKRSGHP